MTEKLDRISIDPGILGGQPVVRGTRLTVSLIVESIAHGDTPEALLEAYPFLTAEDVRDALLFAAMSAGNLEIEEAALTLEPHRRAQLAATLIKSLEPEDVDADDAARLEELWKREAADRLERYRAGEVEPVPWDVVKKQLRERNQ